MQPLFQLTKRIACLVGIGIVALASLSSQAVTKRYSYDDSGGSGLFKAGTGTFCLQVNEALGDYAATSVSGEGGLLGNWGGVTFSARIGSYPSLVISNLVGTSITTSVFASAGGELAEGASAAAEWEHYISTVGASYGIVIREIGECDHHPVPDAGSTSLLTVVTLVGWVGFARVSRGRRTCLPIQAGGGKPRDSLRRS